ncbi:hypothetical protein BE17_12540 [Sorangium cellulosum]|uniref:Uncharacterized protein n=1 Tax=Sorangium cellulosum TaxID=56 RepID=A0A150SKW6_SORCE|nr:hypothetical protein BE17_12540 [Sorangium cellulosum]
MAPQTSYSIYVRFRGRRLALMKHIRSLETACSALRALRAERFHDADQVFLVNDATKQIVDEDRGEDAREPGASREIRVSIFTRSDEQRRKRKHGAGNEAARALRGGKVPALLESHEAASVVAAPAERSAWADDGARRDQPERRWSRIESLEPPRTRLRRAMAAAHVARARHGAALEALARLQPNGTLDEATLIRLRDSARAVSIQSTRVLEQLEQLLARLDGAR